MGEIKPVNSQRSSFFDETPPDGVRIARMMEWENGAPKPKYSINFDETIYKQTIQTALALPYRGQFDPETGAYTVEPEFEGLPNGVVAILRIAEQAANGDISAFRELSDRVAGKPKQEVQSTNLNLGYDDWLKQLPDDKNEKQVVEVPSEKAIQNDVFT